MSRIYNFTQALPTPRELKSALPASDLSKKCIVSWRKQATDIIAKRGQRVAIIVGPCSIHDANAAKEYARKLKDVIPDLSSHFFVVMRVYLEKARTRLGWKGFLYDNRYAIDERLAMARKLFLEITDIGIPIATEFLDPMLAPYFSDIITWGVVGARTTSSQIHRHMASNMPMPIGFKNTTDGNTRIAINAVASSQHSHPLISIDESGRPSLFQSQGNPNTHIILRGGETSTNYDKDSIAKTVEILKDENLTPRFIIDCSHGNCEGNYMKQKDVFTDLIDQIHNDNVNIAGMMIESNLEGGRHEPPTYKQSITDPCLGWDDTKKILFDGHKKLAGSS